MRYCLLALSFLGCDEEPIGTVADALVLVDTRDTRDDENALARCATDGAVPVAASDAGSCAKEERPCVDLRGDVIGAFLSCSPGICLDCGAVIVTFDEAGCAVSARAGGASIIQPTEGAMRCLLQRLGKNQWRCAAGTTFRAYQNCE